MTRNGGRGRMIIGKQSPGDDGGDDYDDYLYDYHDDYDDYLYDNYDDYDDEYDQGPGENDKS